MPKKKFYNPKEIETKWQKKWKENEIYEPDIENAKKPFYNLMMFPYPSAEGLHVGNMYAFTGSDIYGRFKRMQGYDVFEPMGLDGFGIHSENYAIKTGMHPAKQAKISEKRFYKQLQMIGNGFAWNERLETYDPEYYKWTQWIFVQMFKNGLAYRKKQSVNWCPSCKTVLADEQVVSGECERCSSVVIKKDLEQWFFKITKYAGKLLKNLEHIDWSENIKVAQKNWIGKSEGALIKFPILNSQFLIDVFTTRPDTLFGATYMVLAPEHELIKKLESKIKNLEEVKKYIEKAKKKSEIERTSLTKNKTGVELKGIKAINPANKEKIPVFIADYVLSSYGTGAIMAVPAHDERDWDFVEKYNLPIQEVIVPKRVDKRNPPISGKKKIERRNVHVFIRNPKDKKILCLKWKKFPWITFPMGGIEKGESIIEAAKREAREETGYKNFKNAKILGGQVRAEYFAAHKDENRVSYTNLVSLELENKEKNSVAEHEHDSHEPFWVELSKLTTDYMVHAEMDIWLERISKEPRSYIGDGILINSGKFDGMDSEKAKSEITKFVNGKTKVQYRLRDWLISRQRYWGPPIPMIYCEYCAKEKKGEYPPAGGMPGWYAVSEKDLPVELPLVKDFRPQGKGKSPLASVKSFYEVKCPACGKKARRETDVSDTFFDSSWYYLRYLTPNNKKSAWDSNIVKKWLPTNMYIGGAEHSVLHLLYVRFVAMALYDWGMISFNEPFKKFRAHGLIIKEGAKMSKSKGNVVNPDEYVKRFGADTLRMYLMFLAPFEQGGSFRDSAVMGIARFLNRVWKIFNGYSAGKYSKPDKKVQKVFHQAIKKITEDIESLSYNTAISSLMILLNEMESNEKLLERKDMETFLKLLAPFAPHMTEELWHQLGNKKSVHIQLWPKYDEKMIIEDLFSLVIQINGKLRDTIEMPVGASDKKIKERALVSEKIKKFLDGKKPKKFIIVKNRLINIVV